MKPTLNKWQFNTYFGKDFQKFATLRLDIKLFKLKRIPQLGEAVMKDDYQGFMINTYFPDPRYWIWWLRLQKEFYKWVSRRIYKFIPFDIASCEIIEGKTKYDPYPGEKLAEFDFGNKHWIIFVRK